MARAHDLLLAALLLAGCSGGAARSADGADAAPGADGGRFAHDGGTPGPADSGSGESDAADAGPMAHDDAAPTTDAGQGLDAGLPTRADAWDELRRAVLRLRTGWRFARDPGDIGQRDQWFARQHDDRQWSPIEAGRTWEDQGHPGYDGVAWYRRTVDIPADWSGSSVRLAAAGIDDEYDVYINGTHVRHHGQAPDRSVWGWRTFTRVDPMLVAGATNTVAIRVVDWGGGGGIWRDIELRRRVPLDPYRHLLPAPVIDAEAGWVELYWTAWQMAFEKIAFGNADNGFVDAYMDEGFNEQIYQWDSSFIATFGRYGLALFPAMATLDNFYGKQRADGYIQRVYSETSGGELETPTADEPVVNPPLFAWVEHDYYRFTGDATRLTRVFDGLERYFGWLETNARSPLVSGLYYQTDLGSGMDNLPRGDVRLAGWVDMSAQQALSARMLAQIAEVLGRANRRTHWQQVFEAARDRINQAAWSEADGIYYDVARGGAHAGVRHIGAFWTLLAGVAGTRAARLITHLEDPAEFGRPHPFPTLAATEPAYADHGHYWRGSVWAPTNYMVFRGLRDNGRADLARSAAAAHLEMMARVLLDAPPDEARIAPEERDGEYATIWECYAPDGAAPATRWDGINLSRQDFVGWSGLGPIAALFEDVIGLDVDGARGVITWTVTRTDRHGVLRMPFGLGGSVDLIAEPRASASAPVEARIRTWRALDLVVRRPGQPDLTRRLDPGTHDLRLQ